MTDQIIDLLVLAITSHLDQKLRIEIPSSDPSRAKVVKAYRYQQNPLTDEVHFWVAGGDIGDTKFRDGRVSITDMDDLGMKIPVGEVGGGHHWWRRGRVGLGCYYIEKKFKQDVAARHAHNALGRATHEIEQAPITGLVDSWSERALYIFVYASSFTEGGGPTDQYIWRGEIYWQVLTHRQR